MERAGGQPPRRPTARPASVAARRPPRARALAGAALVSVTLTALAYGLQQWEARESTDAAVRLIAQGEHEAAVRSLLAQVARAPADARLHYHLGRAYARLGVEAGAISQFREAVRLAPREARFRAHLGQAYRDAGQLPEALRELEEAARLDAADPEYHVQLAGVLLEQGRTAAALERLRRATALRPSSPEIRFLLAAALGQAGDPGGMRQAYQEVIRLAGASPLGEAARQALRRPQPRAGVSP